MIKSYDLPNGRKITAEFDENGISKITVQALDSLISELNNYATPCEDAVSRQAVLDALYDLFDVKNDRLVQIPWSASAIDARINALPSVQPKQKDE